MSENKAIFLLLLALLLAAFLANLCVGASGFTPEDLLGTLLHGETESAAARILRYVRFPRTLAAMLAGASLAAAGCLLQTVLRNPLAAPSVIGVNSGAGLCALVCTAFFSGSPQYVSIAAFLGACAAAFAVYLLARLTGASKSTIVLAGVAVNSIFGAAMDAIIALIPDAVVSRSAFSIGGFSTVSMCQIGFAAPLIMIGFLCALLWQRELNLLNLGDDAARSLGVKVERFRALFLIVAAMLAGAAVSFAGLVSFVGLIAPHMARILCKNDARLQLPITAAFGALLCLICDFIARMLFAPYELPVGVVLSFMGAPFFLYLLLVRKKRSRHGGL